MNKASVGPRVGAVPELPSQEPGLVWFLTTQNGEKGIVRALRRVGGRDLGYVGDSHSDPLTVEVLSPTEELILTIDGQKGVPLSPGHRLVVLVHTPPLVDSFYIYAPHRPLPGIKPLLVDAEGRILARTEQMGTRPDPEFVVAVKQALR